MGETSHGEGDLMCGQSAVSTMAQIGLEGGGEVVLAAAAHVFAVLLLHACPIFRPFLICPFRGGRS